MDSTLNPIAAGNGNGIGQRLIGLQPPLSPTPVASAAPSAPAPVPVATAPPPPAAPAETPPSQPSNENLLVRFGLLTVEQVDEALREQRATGKHVAQIAVERGWVTREQLAQLVTQSPTAEAPAPPEPTPTPAPAADSSGRDEWLYRRLHRVVFAPIPVRPLRVGTPEADPRARAFHLRCCRTRPRLLCRTTRPRVESSRPLPDVL